MGTKIGKIIRLVRLIRLLRILKALTKTGNKGTKLGAKGARGGKKAATNKIVPLEKRQQGGMELSKGKIRRRRLSSEIEGRRG